MCNIHNSWTTEYTNSYPKIHNGFVDLTKLKDTLISHSSFFTWLNYQKAVQSLWKQCENMKSFHTENSLKFFLLLCLRLLGQRTTKSKENLVQSSQASFNNDKNYF